MKGFIGWVVLNVAISVGIVLATYLIVGAGLAVVLIAPPIAGIVGGVLGYARFKFVERKVNKLYGN